MQEIELPLEDFDELPDDHKSGFVAVVGRPNAGKSTLMNALMQQKIAIVTARPQTTRTKQLGILTAPNYQIVFMDTPGIMRKTRHHLDKFMLETALATLADADLILWVVDGSQRPGQGVREIAQQLQKYERKIPIILAINKIDVVPPKNVLAASDMYSRLMPASEWLFISALKKQGTDELLQKIVAILPLGPRFYPPDQVTDAFMRDMAAELIREQVLHHLRDEIPHGMAVKVTDFKERENGTVYIAATIFVDREPHKRIVIGKKGELLRRIGSKARKEIEALVDAKVYTELWVKVAPNWRQQARDLKRFGYAE